MSAGVFGTFESISKNFRLRPRDVVVDNVGFRFHYRATTLILLAASLLVSSRQYIGEHISCIVADQKTVPENVMNTFCFFMATFTVPRHLNTSDSAHPGVGPVTHKDDIIRHNYYQWVPFVLFGQALFFYLPHYAWKIIEGGRLKNLTTGLRHAAFSITDCSELKSPSGDTIPTYEDTSKYLNVVRTTFLERLHIETNWSRGLLACEFLNLVNLIMQFWLTDVFLGGNFVGFGPWVLESRNDKVDAFDIVFPKITKCTFHKYGPSGTLQAHDAMCVMALNIVNEKIFVFLWFWYVILAIVTIMSLLWRIVAACLHSQSSRFNRWAFSMTRPGGRNPWTSGLAVTHEFHFGDWLFLYYLAKNMDGFVFQNLFKRLAETLEDARPLIDLENRKHV